MTACLAGLVLVLTLVAVRVTDNGEPSLSATQKFSILVSGAYTLSISSSKPEAVEVNPVGSLNEQGTRYTKDVIVAATAKPPEGYLFDHWVVGSTVSTVNPVVFRMLGNRQLQAHFVALSEFQLP